MKTSSNPGIVPLILIVSIFPSPSPSPSAVGEPLLVKVLLEDTRPDMEDWMEGPDQNPFGVSALDATGDGDP